MTARALEIRIGNYGWTHSDYFVTDPEDDTPDDDQECFTCGVIIPAGAAHWYSDDTGEIVHETCTIPDFDSLD